MNSKQYNLYNNNLLIKIYWSGNIVAGIVFVQKRLNYINKSNHPLVYLVYELYIVEFNNMSVEAKWMAEIKKTCFIALQNVINDHICKIVTVKLFYLFI